MCADATGLTSHCFYLGLTSEYFGHKWLEKMTPVPIRTVSKVSPLYKKTPTRWPTFPWTLLSQQGISLLWIINRVVQGVSASELDSVRNTCLKLLTALVWVGEYLPTSSDCHCSTVSTCLSLKTSLIFGLWPERGMWHMHIPERGLTYGAGRTLAHSPKSTSSPSPPLSPRCSDTPMRRLPLIWSQRLAQAAEPLLSLPSACTR